MSAEPAPETYLGDGLYARNDGYQICLYASNGITTSDEVFLDRDTLARLNVWVAQL